MVAPSDSDSELSDAPTDVLDLEVEGLSCEVRNETSASEREDNRGGDTESDVTKQCKCSREVPESWKTALKSKRSCSVAKALYTLSKWNKYKCVCYAHSLVVGSRLGLITNQLNEGQLEQRLHEVYEKRLVIGKLKTEPGTYRWFRRSHRPRQPADALGPYKFAPKKPDVFDYDQKILLRDFEKGLAER